MRKTRGVMRKTHTVFARDRLMYCGGQKHVTVFVGGRLMYCWGQNYVMVFAESCFMYCENFSNRGVMRKTGGVMRKTHAVFAVDRLMYC